jgi:hypothetical protein
MRRITSQTEVEALQGLDIPSDITGLLQDAGAGIVLTGTGIGAIALSERLGGDAQTAGTILGLGTAGAGALQLTNTVTGNNSGNGDGNGGSVPDTPPEQVKDQITLTGFNPSPQQEVIGNNLVGLTSGGGPKFSVSVENNSNTSFDSLYYGLTVVPPESVENSKAIAFQPREFSLGSNSRKTLRLDAQNIGANISVKNVLKRSTNTQLSETNILNGELLSLNGDYTVRQSIWNKPPSQGLDGLVRLADTGNYSFNVLFLTPVRQ